MSSIFIGFGSAPPSSQIQPANGTYRRSSHRTIAVAVAAAAERKKKSLYEVLRVKETASMGEIKAAYRALAKRFHPDVDPVGNNNDGSEFMEIRGAYATLSDPVARGWYDIDGGIKRQVGLQTTGGYGIRRRWETDQCW